MGDFSSGDHFLERGRIESNSRSFEVEHIKALFIWIKISKKNGLLDLKIFFVLCSQAVDPGDQLLLSASDID